MTDPQLSAYDDFDEAPADVFRVFDEGQELETTEDQFDRRMAAAEPARIVHPPQRDEKP